ncbi:hypothetical protein G7Y89_g10951 [Cudoniella acicularis]|uniref:Uncharacterized protein n=1 Tax=Cudoniella acicularis TaxID=354080 RepID=A0A8H4REG1_9HELO|nr:hypothetical protein G7Y89_g10951 [Cudoniella acicularis]
MFTRPAPESPADPVVKGILPTAKQGWRYLFIWRQRAVITNDFNETHCVWQDPPPLRNPFKHLAQLSLRDDRRRLRLPPPLNSNRQIRQILQNLKYQHHHRNHTDPTLAAVANLFVGGATDS